MSFFLAPQDRLRLHVHRSLPVPCTLCSGRETSTSGCQNLYKHSLQVFHGARSPVLALLVRSIGLPFESVGLRTGCSQWATRICGQHLRALAACTYCAPIPSVQR